MCVSSGLDHLLVYAILHFCMVKQTEAFGMATAPSDWVLCDYAQQMPLKKDMIVK